MADIEQQASPEAKRVKLDSADTVPQDVETRMTESRAGITSYIDPTLPGFQGIIKQRFTDFMVNEIDLQGNVCHLISLDPPPGKLLSQLRPDEAASTSAPAAAAEPSAEEQVAADAKARIDSGDWPADADDRLDEFFEDDKIAILKDMWSRGKTGESMATGANATIVSAASATTRALENKEERTQVHKLIRELFHGKLATDSVAIRSWAPRQQREDEEDARANAASTSNGPATAIAVRWANRSDRRAGDDLSEEATSSPPYIHFLLHKTNRDHQEAMSMLAESLRLGGGGGGRGRGRGRGGFGGRGGGRPPTKDLGIAGTKDKRAVTVQRVSLKRNRKTLEDVYRLVNGINADVKPDSSSNGKGKGRGRTVIDATSKHGDRGIRIGHLSYSHSPLKLGQLMGNEFTITLRNVRPPPASTFAPAEFESSIVASMDVLRDRGFINYFGMQRFGTGAVPTHHIGILILQNDFKGAIDLLFEPRSASSPTSDDGDSLDLLKAKQLFKEGAYDKAYYAVPRNCVAEKHILDKMRSNKWNRGDWVGAFNNIPRTLRLMYVHAYQSFVWNKLVSERIERFGSDKAVEGDIVFADEDKDGDWAIDAAAAGGEDMAERLENEEEDEDDLRNSGALKEALATWQRPTKVLTAADAANHSIYDVIVPLPGSSITVPSGWMHNLYTSILTSSSLTHDQLISAKIPEYQLKGSYRRMIVKPRHFSYAITKYTDPDKPLTFTDEERCLGLAPDPAQAVKGDKEGAFTAVTLHFQLPSSSYATMLMREALKQDTSSHKHRQMTQNSADQMFKGTALSTPSAAMFKAAKATVEPVQEEPTAQEPVKEEAAIAEEPVNEKVSMAEDPLGQGLVAKDEPMQQE